MTIPIDRPAAEALARAALTSWGVGPTTALETSACPGGWRVRVLRALDADPALGASDAIVRASDGAVLRVPSGASDAAVSRLVAP